jgi:hypothetical protein
VGVKRVGSRAAAQANNPVSVAPNVYTDQQRSFYDPLQDNAPAYSVSTAWPSSGDAHWKETQLIVATGQASASDVVSFSLPRPATQGTCSNKVPVLGYADEYTNTPVFQVSLQVESAHVTNSVDGTTSFTWRASGTEADTVLNGTFPCSALGSAASASLPETVTFSTTLQPGVQLGEVLPQNFTVTYPQHLCATGGQASWQGSGPSAYTVSGFGSKGIAVWRVTGTSITRFAKISATHEAGGACGEASAFAASFADSGSSSATYFASSSPLTPASARPLDLASITHGRARSVRYLIITAPKFVPTLRPLASYYDRRRLPAKIVTVDAIFDQYRSRLGRFTGTGSKAGTGDAQLNPDAIRAYVTFAVKHLGVQYVLLGGGDTMDPLNYYGCPESGLCAGVNPRNLSIVPTLYENSIFDGPTAADNLFVVPLGQSTTAPDAAIGRLPAVTASELRTEVSRSIHFRSWVKSYRRRATFVSGFGTSVNYGQSCADPAFPSASDEMASDLPSAWMVNKAYEDGNHADDLANHDRLLALFDQGQEIVNYMGHGNLRQWSCLPALTSNDVPSLTNVNRPAAVFQWGCQATDFVNPRLSNIDSLLLEAQRNGRVTGAAVTVGSTGLDLAYPQAQLAGATGSGGPPGFYGYLVKGQSVGEALRHAKDDMVASYWNGSARQTYADVVNSYTILGDPALTLPF